MKNANDLKKSAAPYNPRDLSAKQEAILKKTMAEYGDLSGIVLNTRTGRMIGGHQRVKIFDSASKVVKKKFSDDVGTVAHGYIDTPSGRWSYREVDWDEKKEIAANLAANKGGGQWNFPKLTDLLVDLDDGVFDMEFTGFERCELEDLLAPTGGGEPEAPPEDNYAEQFGVIVLCDDEAHQEEVYNMLHEQGYKAKVVNT